MYLRNHAVGQQERSGQYRLTAPIKRSLDARDLNEKLHFYHIKPKSKSASLTPIQRWQQQQMSNQQSVSSGKYLIREYTWH